MEKRRVVITGMGVVAPNGIGIENFWDSLVHGRSGIRRITHFDASSYPCQVAAEVPDFNPTDYMAPKTAKRLARFAQFALVASKMAIEDSKIDLASVDPYRIGVIVGTGSGGAGYSEGQHIAFVEKGIKRISPFAAVMSCDHSAVGIISYELGLKGTNTTISTACNSGLDAVYLAYNSIRLGDADIMLTGAGEAPITPYIVALFCAGDILTKNNGIRPSEALKPFDRDGDGIVLGEGGASLILEDLEHALKRKAKIYGEILGYASGNETYDLFKIDPSGNTASMVMKKSIMNANLKPPDINYINAHGNGLIEYDLNETSAIKKVFGALAYQIPVTSIKPITGQSFSVTGILQMATCLLVINKGIIPPTINHTNPHPECDLDYVPNQFRKSEVKTALMNAHGFGGSHTVVIAGRFNKFKYRDRR
ncbi:MAG: beta-ketoacyl-[acyl-carrier-protein] synthase family protein [candidate division Zixibacteria bacterium]|nr:beta-ketoacyl-[acyl-carrier-protein] synthase family protein [candidate division Zixibacteria bacterium]